ncbi:hypothetical protein ES703_74364 [subsurface metagenome]
MIGCGPQRGIGGVQYGHDHCLIALVNNIILNVNIDGGGRLPGRHRGRPRRQCIVHAAGGVSARHRIVHRGNHRRGHV